MAKNTTSVPAIYDGREQAWIKHRLLGSYLEKLLLIIGMAARSQGKVEICYVDCFAGPWGDESEQMEGTSIAISMRTMALCKQRLAKLGVNATMRALYIELDKRAFGRLSDYLQKATPPRVDAQCKEGDFLALRQDILTWCGNTAFAFFFIDPESVTSNSSDTQCLRNGWRNQQLASEFPCVGTNAAQSGHRTHVRCPHCGAWFFLFRHRRTPAPAEHGVWRHP